MKIFRNITLATVVVWILCFLTVLLSKNKHLDETMMVFSILSSYLSVILVVCYLVVSIIIKIKSKN